MPRNNTVLYSSVWEFLTRVIDLVGMFIAMFLSEMLVENIILGGALYVLGEVWVTYVRLYNKRSIRLLPTGIRSKGVLVFVIAGLLSAALLFFYPYLLSQGTTPVLAMLIGLFIAGQIVTDTAAKRLIPGTRKRLGTLLLLHTLFLAAYAVLFYCNHLIIGYAIPPQIGTLYLAVLGLDLLLLICQLHDQPDHEAAPEPCFEEGPDADQIMNVHAYRIYNNMVINALFAVNLAITGFICFMRFMPHSGLLESIVSLIVWLSFITLVTAACFFLLRKRYLARYDRYIVFGAGLLLWAAAALGVLTDFLQGYYIGNFLNVACMGASLACMLSIILEQGRDMKTVIELGVGKIDQGAYARNTSVMIDWSTLTSYLLVLVMLTIASFLMDGKLDRIEAIEGMQRFLRILMLALPMLFVLAGMVFSLLQPLDKHYADKLKKYTRQREEGKANPPLEARLQKILVANYPKRIAMLVLKPIIRPFLPCKVYGKENVDLSEGPVIFVCNHLELYGPIIAVLHSPFQFRPWVIHNMLDKQIISDHIRGSIDHALRFLPRAARLKLIRIAAPILLWIMHSTDPIPVFRGTVREVIKTIQLSVEALAYDDNILLFPEINYQQEGVGDFFTGFVQVAKSYYKQTGKCASFYPVYIDKRGHRMSYGKGIAFDPSRSAGAEKDRIVDYLKETMNGMASEQRKDQHTNMTEAQ